MNRKRVLLFFLILGMLFLFAACGGAKGILLQEEASNVEEATIYYDDGTKITLDSSEENLAKLAKSLAKTKTEEKTTDSITDPNFFSTFKYAIDLTYADTTVEQIFSNDGVNYFRFINNDQSYIGGENSDVSELLEEIKASDTAK